MRSRAVRITQASILFGKTPAATHLVLACCGFRRVLDSAGDQTVVSRRLAAGKRAGVYLSCNTDCNLSKVPAFDAVICAAIHFSVPACQRHALHLR